MGDEFVLKKGCNHSTPCWQPLTCPLPPLPLCSVSLLCVFVGRHEEVWTWEVEVSVALTTLKPWGNVKGGRPLWWKVRRVQPPPWSLLRPSSDLHQRLPQHSSQVLGTQSLST